MGGAALRGGPEAATSARCPPAAALPRAVFAGLCNALCFPRAWPRP
jgi:hypothetical protein